MVGKLSHERLDRSLEALASEPEQFIEAVEELAQASEALDLEISDPQSWRENARVPGEGARTSVEHQLRLEIARIETMDREQETRLARRIEFARIRLARAAKQAGLETVQAADVSRPTCVRLGAGGGRCSLPPRVRRRWMECHALRLEMVERNLYLVLINVRRYARTNAGLPDLIQEGAASLFRAVDRFDWRRGLLFRTYAIHWMNQAFRAHLYNFGSTVRVPVYLQKALKHIAAAIGRHGDPGASAEEIAILSGHPVNLVRSARSAARRTLSLDGRVGDAEDSARLGDLLTTDPDDGPYTPGLEDVSLEQGLEEALQDLSDRQRLVIAMRFGIGGGREHTLAQVAKVLGVSLERVRQIQVRAIAKMRTPRLLKAMDPFVG